jgi:hypothetical protein
MKRLIIAMLLAFITPAGAETPYDAWECDNGISVELYRVAVRTFEIRLGFSNPDPSPEHKPRLLSFKDGRTPTGNFNLKFTSRGAMLNGKLCRSRTDTESWSRKSVQDDKWSFCLTAGTLWPANQERQ